LSVAGGGGGDQLTFGQRSQKCRPNRRRSQKCRPPPATVLKHPLVRPAADPTQKRQEQGSRATG
jgi:hypothetical protein